MKELLQRLIHAFDIRFKAYPVPTHDMYRVAFYAGGTPHRYGKKLFTMKIDGLELSEGGEIGALLEGREYEDEYK